MPIPNNYPNLPGFVAQINDQGLRIASPQQNLTPSVLLLGVSTDGPLGQPVRVQSIAQAEQIFGVTTANPAITAQGMIQKSLTRGIYELYQAGCTDVRLVRVSGTSASITLADATTASNSVVLTAGYPGVKYNSLTATVTPATSATSGSIVITTLDGVAHTFSFTTTSLYGDLINAINQSNINVQATQGYAGNALAPVNLSAVSSATKFANGADGTNLTDTQYSNALAAVYPQLEDYDVDVVVPLGAYLQPTYALDASGNATILNTNSGDTVWFGQNLAEFCARLSVREHQVVGVISIAPLLTPTFVAVNQRLAQLQNTQYTFTYVSTYATPGSAIPSIVMGTDNKPVDLGRWLCVCAGPEVVVNNPNFGNYVADPAAAYAGRMVSLPPQAATTNKVMGSVLALAYTYGASSQNALVGQRFTIFSISNGSVRTVADPTYAYVGSDFANLSTVRVVYNAIDAVEQAARPYIGVANTTAIINAMGTDVSNALKGIKDVGGLIDYTWSMRASSADQVAGNFFIDLVLVPPLEMKQIYVSVRLQPPAASNTVSG